MTRSCVRGEGDDFEALLARLTAAAVPADLCEPFVGAAGVAGAVISTLGRPMGSQTVAATDDTAARIGEIQIDLGEGPGWDALRMRRPVLESDLDRGGEEWPAVREALRLLPVGALYAFPLFVGALSVGTVDLYSAQPRTLELTDVDAVTVLASVASRHLLRWALDGLDDTDGGMPEGPHSRREMHQASGMVAAQLSISVSDALLVLRGRAFSSGRTVAAVAADVVARRITFAP